MAHAPRILPVLVLAAALALPGTALADVQEYSGMVPERIEKEIRAERKAYKALKKELYELENGAMDKASAEYKARHDDLLKRAVDHKVRLDEMLEALDIQQRAFNN